MLKPGGLFLLIDNVAPDDAELADYINTVEKMRDVSHVRNASIREWRNWTDAVGLHVVKERSHKKNFVFEPWVRRMVESNTTVQEIEQYLLNGSQPARDYFAVTETYGHVTSFQGDQWMAMAVKVKKS